MTITRRTFLQSFGAAGAMAFNPSFVSSVAAQAISAIRPSFSGRFRLASSPLIDDDDLSGVRLRWNFPLFNEDGTYARCLPDRVLVYRRVESMSDYLVPKAPDVGLEPTGVYLPFAWQLKIIVQVSSNPYAFEFRDRAGNKTTADGLKFQYQGGSTARLKVIGMGGHCLVVTSIQPGQTFYFDAARMVRFELETAGGALLVDAACLDIELGGEINLNEQIAELEVRRPLAEGLSLEDGALRLNSLALSGGKATTLPSSHQFLDASDWSELMSLATEIAADVCTGAPELVEANGSQVAKTDLFLAAAVSRWEMAPRLGFGFRDGNNLSASTYDKIYGPELDLTPRDAVVLHQLEAIWDDGDRVRSTVSSSRLDKRFEIGRPQLLQYLARIQGEVDSDYIAVDVTPTNSLDPTPPSETVQVAQTTLNWQHANFERTAGVLVEETYSRAGGAVSSASEWLQHRGVFSEGFRGNVKRYLPVTFDDEVVSTIRSFDAWDRLSTDFIEAKPKVVLGYEPEAPRLAAATHLASLDEADGKILVERLVTTPDYRPSTLPAAPADGGPALEFEEWAPDPLMLELVKRNFRFSLGIYEAIARPKVVAASISLYARDGLGSFVEFDRAIDLSDFVGGFLDAPNGRYHARSSLGTRLYVGRMSKDLSLEFDKATCQLTSSAINIDETDEPLLGPCLLTQDYDAEEFWRLVDTISDIDSVSIDYTFLQDALTPRPIEEADAVDYRLRVWGERNADRITGRFSNYVSAQRLPRRPGPPRGFQVRQLGYDYYDRLLVCCQLGEEDGLGTYAVQFAAGRFDSLPDFLEVAEQTALIGPQLVGASRTMFDCLPIGRNFQTDRIYTVGISRVNKAGTFGPPAIAVVRVPVE